MIDLAVGYIALMMQGMLEELAYQVAGWARTVADAMALIERAVIDYMPGT